jgi:hypothetical protein
MRPHALLNKSRAAHLECIEANFLGHPTVFLKLKQPLYRSYLIPQQFTSQLNGGIKKSRGHPLKRMHPSNVDAACKELLVF